MWPRSLVMPMVLPSKPSTAVAPSATSTFGWIKSICSCRYGMHVCHFLAASACDCRGLAGRVGPAFQNVRDINRLARESPVAWIIFVSNCPALPTNGSPCSSSSAPGASPTNISGASMLPTPNTTFLRDAARCGHLTQAIARSRNSANAAAFAGSVGVAGRTNALMGAGVTRWSGDCRRSWNRSGAARRGLAQCSQFFRRHRNKTQRPAASSFPDAGWSRRAVDGRRRTCGQIICGETETHEKTFGRSESGDSVATIGRVNFFCGRGFNGNPPRPAAKRGERVGERDISTPC